MNIISVKNLFVSYNQNEAVHDVSFDIQKGDFIGLAGPNGSGKSTLAKAILGLVPIDKGEINIFGKKQSDFSEFSKIGYLPQKHSSINPLFPASVEEVVMLGLLAGKKFPKIINSSDKIKVAQILETLQITRLKDKLISSLSGGEQQRVLLARALVSNPELLIFDEPSTALDPISRESFFKLVKKINQEQKTTIILITHDTGYIGTYANKLLYLDRRLVFFGNIEEFCPSGEMETCFEKSGQHIIWHQHN
jgi:zinc transport system ATP-binding protein